MTTLDTILSGVQFLGAFTAAVTALVAWRQRPQPGSLPLALWMLAVTLWGIGRRAQPLATPNGSPSGTRSKFSGVGLTSTLYLVFILEYARQESFSGGESPSWSGWVLLVSAVLAYISPTYFLFWKHPSLGGLSLFLAFLVYYYALRLIATLILARAILRLPPGSHAQARRSRWARSPPG